ncbi:LysR family transcriptional regulator [Moritella sp. Urea-trap-13]|uniref:LysR family transcriptional regulator n=1 Tax=Moritella sp. Urea-trap-13 TaxID=2058327 RepID=UPI000C34009D|nr:LysR family transcriptional regulator [Moritella sp. Urea-trap-13]PKH08147.1 transcriptional regulator [Moritella sp. Urea-trap-13]
MSKLKQMTVFMYVVKLGSITKAAEQLDVSKSVVSQHLKQLESELAVTLLKRTTRKQSLTSAGEHFYQQCCTMHELAEQAWQDAQKLQLTPQGLIKITAPHALMDHLVLPALHEVFHVYPDVELELISHDGRSDLMQEGIDIAIRVGESKMSNLKQKRIGDFRDVLCGSVETINNHQTDIAALKLADNTNTNTDAGKQVNSLAKIPYVANHWQEKSIHHRFSSKKSRSNKLSTPRFELNFKTHHKANTLPTCLSMLEQGFGVGIIPDFIFAKHNNALAELLPEHQLDKVNVYALHAYQAAVPISVTMAIEAIAKRLG